MKIQSVCASALWRNVRPLATHTVPIDDSDQTAHHVPSDLSLQWVHMLTYMFYCAFAQRRILHLHGCWVLNFRLNIRLNFKLNFPEYLLKHKVLSELGSSIRFKLACAYMKDWNQSAHPNTVKPV